MLKTNENFDEIKEKLDYIGLDFNNIPESLKEYSPIEFKTIRENEQKKYKIYKFLNVNDIQIYITPKNRKDSFIEKYKLAKKIINYIEPKEEEDIPLQAEFLKMIKEFSIEDVENIDKIQKEINKKIPFKIRYDKNYLWEIYYSQVYNKYFMLVPAEEENYGCLFYLLKKQMENKNSKVYVPVCYMEYTGELLKKSELNDIENYMWLFTGDWPNVYEVFDKKNNMTIQIVGKTFVYDNLKSDYKIVLKEKDEATKFYKYIKALFILQSEIPNKYKFKTKINGYGILYFEYNNKKITYNILPEFIEKEYKNIKENIINNINQKYEKEIELNNKKCTSKQKDEEYHQKEKEIAIYLECKKSFFGRIKYYLKHKKTLKQVNEKNVTKDYENIEKEKINIEEKQFYTIEDLINLNKKNEEIETEVKNLNLDIEAIDSKIEMMERKIKNATQYINEIDEHNKSLFEFWKFTNKDENLALNEANVNNEINENKLYKTFDIENDYEEFGEKIDKMQRKTLSKIECDSIYITQTTVLESLNKVKNEKINVKNKSILETNLEKLQDEAENQKELFNEEEYDIFGGLSEDNTKIKYIKGKKHREIEKSKFEILKINKNTSEDEFIETLKEINKNIENALKNNKTIENMSIYMCSEEPLNSKNYEIFNMKIENAIRNNDNINLFKINLKENINAVYFSNIIYFDNKNNTLPYGMDISDKVLLDLKQFELEKVDKDVIKINQPDGLYNVVKTLNVYEYNLK